MKRLGAFLTVLLLLVAASDTRGEIVPKEAAATTIATTLGQYEFTDAGAGFTFNIQEESGITPYTEATAKMSYSTDNYHRTPEHSHASDARVSSSGILGADPTNFAAAITGSSTIGTTQLTAQTNSVRPLTTYNATRDNLYDGQRAQHLAVHLVI